MFLLNKDSHTKILMYIALILGIAFLFFKYGNNDAVTKSRALDIISEANKRALVVARKINRNTKNPVPFTLEEENEPEYIRAVRNVTLGDSKNQFALTFYYVDEDICEQIVKLVDKDSIIRKVSPCKLDPFILTYNNDLSPIDYECNEKGCLCKNNAVYLPFLDNPCEYNLKNSASDCRNNTDCNDNQYCDYLGGSSSMFPNYGTCKNKGNLTKMFTYYSSTENNDFYKGPEMPYWSIYNFCHAHSMRPVSMKDVQCSLEDKCSVAFFYEEIGRFWVTDYAFDNMAYNVGRNNKNLINQNPLNSNISALCIKEHTLKQNISKVNFIGTKYKILGKIQKQDKNSETTIYEILDTQKDVSFKLYIKYINNKSSTIKTSSSKYDSISIEVSVIVKDDSKQKNFAQNKQTVIYKQTLQKQLTEKNTDMVLYNLLYGGTLNENSKENSETFDLLDAINTDLLQSSTGKFKMLKKK